MLTAPSARNLGKTRLQGPLRPLGARSDSLASSCGTLERVSVPGSCRHTRYPAPAALHPWVQHFWLESWHFPQSRGERREMLPHPSVHLVFVPGAARIYGVQRGVFTRELRGRGCIFGVRFWPGAFHPFLGEPVSSLTDAVVGAEGVFAGATRAGEAILACETGEAMVRNAARLLLQHLPRPDPKVTAMKRAVQTIAADPALTRVSELARRVATGERTLQRLFRRYVGVSACWTIKRYRTYEALTRLAHARSGQLAELAQRLGYFDQSHFNRDLRLRTGRAPAVYRKATPG
jgi:AraC-like DNA-binding protein